MRSLPLSDVAGPREARAGDPGRHAARASLRRATRLLVVAPVVLALGGCHFLWWGGDDAKGKAVSVFDLTAGDCTLTPTDVTVEITKIDRVACSVPHQQEVYAAVPYVDATTGDAPDAFPGNDALTAFADGTCAEAYTTYVGVDYRDSRLYFTYLLPSARGWEQDGDRQVVCFVTTTGDVLTQSVKNTKW